MAAAERRLGGEPVELEGVADWPPVTDSFDWSAAVQGLHDAFMASTGHRANILRSSYNRVGIGVVAEQVVVVEQ